MAKRALLILSGFLAMIVLIELVLHIFPVSTGYDLGAVNAEHPIVHGAAHFKYTYSKDWNFHLANSGVLNSDGFRSSYDYIPDSRSITVIGNSFIQADAVIPKDALTEQLGSLLHRPAYAVGGDGFSLADYLAASRWASDRFGSRLLVVLLTTGDLSHSCVRHLGGHYLERQEGTMTSSLVERPPQSSLKAALNDSKLFRYVYDNLRVAANWSKAWQRIDEHGDVLADPAGSAALLGCTDSAYADAATRFLLKSFHDVENSRGVRLIFILAPGYRSEQLLAAGAIRDVDVFAHRAAADGFDVIRLDAAFAEALAHGARLDFLPVDGHWNGTAHALAAQLAAQAISRHLGAR